MAVPGEHPDQGFITGLAALTEAPEYIAEQEEAHEVISPGPDLLPEVVDIKDREQEAVVVGSVRPVPPVAQGVPEVLGVPEAQGVPEVLEALAEVAAVALPEAEAVVEEEIKIQIQ